jgi:plasmid stabilization system protein ParE
LRRADIRELLFQGYRIVYRLENERVVILAIVHAARDLGRMPPPWEIV